MNKNRLENFSDGVFAIAVTLLILNVRIPQEHDLSNGHLNLLLYHIVPHVITFAFTFLVVGVFWVAHHRIFSFVKVPDSTLLWLNIVYLLFVVIIPVPASILSENPFLPTAILVYSLTLLVIALMHFVILQYILKHAHLKHEVLTPTLYRAAQKSAVVGPACYVLAAAGCYISTYISFFFILVSIIYYIFIAAHGKLEEKLVQTASKEANS